LGAGFFVQNRTISAVKRVSDRLLYMVLRGRWFNIIVLHVHAPSEEKSDDSLDRFYEELEQVSYHFPKYHMKILSGDFNVTGGKRIFANRKLGMRVYIRIVMIVVLQS